MDGLLLKLINDLVAAGQAMLAYAILFFLAYRLLIMYLNNRQKTSHYREETIRQSNSDAKSIFELCLERMAVQHDAFLIAYNKTGDHLEKIGGILGQIQKDIYEGNTNIEAQTAIEEVTEHTFRVSVFKHLQKIHEKVDRLEQKIECPVNSVQEKEVATHAVHN